VDGTVHCRNNDPEKCASEISQYVRHRWGRIPVGLIGLNPAIAEALVKEFGPGSVRITDLNPVNTGKTRFAVEIWDGKAGTEQLVAESVVIIITGTTLVNKTFGAIWESICRHRRDYLIYGVTASGICHLFNLNRFCPYGHNS